MPVSDGPPTYCVTGGPWPTNVSVSSFTQKSPFEPTYQLPTSAWKWSAPPPPPPGPPARWPQSVSSASAVPSVLNTAQPQKPPRSGPQADLLLQLNEMPTWYWASGP
jgi:hypothetical protein